MLGVFFQLFLAWLEPTVTDYMCQMLLLQFTCNQDAACAAENSVAHVGIEKKKDALKFKLTLPSLTVGTVGGGTRLKMQNKNLELLGCSEGKTQVESLPRSLLAPHFL